MGAIEPAAETRPKSELHQEWPCNAGPGNLGRARKVPLAERRGCGRGGQRPDVTSEGPAEDPALLVQGERGLLRPGVRMASLLGGSGAVPGITITPFSQGQF